MALQKAGIPLPPKPPGLPVDFPVPTVPGIPTLPGIPEDRKRIRPDILVITLLDDLNLTLRDLHSVTSEMKSVLERIKGQMERIPIGVMESFDVPVSGNTESIWEVLNNCDSKWFSVTVYNSGPDDVKVRVNLGPTSDKWYQARKARYTTLAQGESVDVDFHAPLIERIYYKGTTPTASATLKIVGEW